MQQSACQREKEKRDERQGGIESSEKRDGGVAKSFFTLLDREAKAVPDGGGWSDADADAVNDHQSKASQEADSANAVTFDRNGWRRE